MTGPNPIVRSRASAVRTTGALLATLVALAALLSLIVPAGARGITRGEVIARVYDRREARETGTFEVTNSVTNSAEARNAARAWARILRKKLEAARAPQG